MKINKVELKNYRIHKEYEQNFESGITLLLGNNGSGKSSETKILFQREKKAEMQRYSLLAAMERNMKLNANSAQARK